MDIVYVQKRSYVERTVWRNCTYVHDTAMLLCVYP